MAAYQDTTLTVHGSEFKGGLAAKGSAIYATNALVTLSGMNSIPTPTFVIYIIKQVFAILSNSKH